MFQTILVPLDGSRLAEGALDTARFLARASLGKLLLVRVSDSPQHDHECLEYLQKLVARLRQEGLPAHSQVLEVGPIGERILSAIEDEQVDLVVLTSHGRGGLQRVLLGSVADQVARYSRVPVMIVGRRSDAFQRFKEGAIELEGMPSDANFGSSGR